MFCRQSRREPESTVCNYEQNALLYSAGNQDGNLNQLSVITSRMPCCTLRAHTGTGVGDRKNPGEVLEKKSGDVLERNQQERTSWQQA